MTEALYRRKSFAAMTDEGVNDFPRLNLADIRIVMGLDGNDAAKSASDL